LSQRVTRQQRPERIRVGDEIFERNDITAARYSESERSTNRKDKLGAPYIFFAGVKYRPVKRYDAFILSQIKSARPEPRGQRGALKLRT
jgi:hypothetical protein